jgi:aspartyl-tRNA(Asn)/glutamyl-tRNA(Gln) amidotransferase subunit A
MKNLNTLTIKEAQKGLLNRDFTSAELVEACYSRIEKYDKILKAFVTIIPKADALKLAEKADDLFSKGDAETLKNKPLLGIPYSVKDSFNTKGYQTTASSKILEGYISPYESTVTQRLNDAGAILIAKDNLDAFAHGGSTETSDFFTTRNPWDIDRVPGGSSGGTAAAVAANMVIFGIGEDTGGSIRGPASWCGITGLKPSYGRVSRYGVIAMASSTDSPGPLVKSVEDAAIVMKVISGKDKFDATSSPQEVPNYEKALNKIDLKGKKIGIPKSFFHEDIESGVIEQVRNAITFFEKSGAEVEEVDFLHPKYAMAVYTIVQRSEVSSNLARFDGIRYGHSRDYFGFEARKRMMLGAYALSTGYYDEYYSKAQKVRTLIINNFNHLFEKYDVLMGPVMPMIAPKLGVSEQSPVFGELIDQLCDPSAMAGMPSISLPCGFSNGLPVGLQVIGPQFTEDRVLSVSYAFQSQTDYHKKFPDLSNLEEVK